MSSIQSFNMPSLLTGISLGIDAVSGAFLMFYALLWISAAVYAYNFYKNGGIRKSFFIFFLPAMIGSTGLIFAMDIVSFYLFYSIMTFSSYGMIVHNRKQTSRYSGRVYIIMAVVGESLLLTAMILAASGAGSVMFKDIALSAATADYRLITGLVLAGFGIKSGVMPLHMWLPLSYTSAPAPGSVILSSAVSNAGLIGLIKFLPLGSVSMPDYAAVCIAAGLFSAFCAVVIGLAQSEPKTLLAYSSISQMGLMFICVGIGLSSTDHAAAALTALVVFGLHHSLNKGALFMGEAISMSATRKADRRLSAMLLLIPAFSLAGLPFTSGEVFKDGLKSLSGSYTGYGSEVLVLLVALTSVGTALLMTRFIALIFRSRREAAGGAVSYSDMPAWLILIASAPILTMQISPEISSEKIFSGLWPVVAGVFLFFALKLTNKILRGRLRIAIPASDLLVPLAGLLSGIIRMIRKTGLYLLQAKCSCRARILNSQSLRNILSSIVRSEEALSLWRVSGVIFLLVAILLYVVVSA